MISRPAWGTASACAFALLLTACGGGSDVDTQVAAPEVQVEASEPAADVDNAANDAPDAANSAASPGPTEPATAPEEPTETADAADVVADATVATVELPAVQVFNLRGGEQADLASFSRPGPTLVWFWAPH